MLLSLALLAGCLSGCDDSVRVDSFAVTPAGHSACPALLAALPGNVSDQSQRRTTGSTFARAYGDPALVVRCGVPQPKGYKFAFCQSANGVDWLVDDIEQVSEDQSLDVDMTTLYRSPAVAVHVPADYRPPTTAMADLAATIRKHTRKTGGCR